MNIPKTWVVLLALLLVGMAIVPMVSAAGTGLTQNMTLVDPTTDNQGYSPVDVIIIDQAIKDATPYYGILVLDENSKQNCLKAIDSGLMNLSAEQRTEIKDALGRIWKKYPVLSETRKGDDGYPSYGGTITTLSFTDRQIKTRLTDEENRQLTLLFPASPSSNAQITSRNAASVRWGGSPTHSQISYWAAQKALFPNPNTVASNAPVPDTWFESAPWPFDILFHSLNHYYSPAGIGGAPNQAQSYVNSAKSYYNLGSSYYTQAATHLGYATHFLEDVGNPMHTGREIDQAANQWTHSNYENHVNARWNNRFESLVANNYNYFWYVDWRQGTIDLANYSNGYLDTLYMRVYNLGPSWDYTNADTTVDSISDNVILRTAKFTNGMALYAKT